MKNTLTHFVKIAFVVGSLAFANIAGAAWTSPPASPTTCPTSTDGCNPPINTGGAQQRKSGELVLGGTGTPLGVSSFAMEAFGNIFAPAMRLGTSAAVASGFTLDVTGAASIYGIQDAGALAFSAFASLTPDVSYPRLNYVSDVGNGASGLSLRAYNIGFKAGASGDTTTKMLINSSGNVGIGVTSPTQKLDVAGYVKASTGFCIAGSCITSWSLGGGGGSVSGTTGHIAKFTSSTAVGDSSIVEGGESHFWNGTYTDPAPGSAFAIKATSISAGTLKQGNTSVCLQNGTNCPTTVQLYFVTTAPSGDGDGRVCGELGDSTSLTATWLRAGFHGSGTIGYMGWGWFPAEMLTTHLYCRSMYGDGDYVWPNSPAGHMAS